MDPSVINNLFYHHDSTKLSAAGHLLDDVRSTLASTNSGVNKVFVKNSAALPTVTTTYYSGEIVDSTDKLLLLSSNPMRDSKKLATIPTFDNIVLGDWYDPMLSFHNIYDDVNYRCHLVLDRFPSVKQSFVGLVQMDSFWDTEQGRHQVVQYATEEVSIYENKFRNPTSHQHGGYQFYFGNHQHCQ